MTQKELRHPPLDTRDVSVFDSCRAGKRVRAERYDEPGAESPTEASITDPTVRHRKRSSILTADTNGDWSWKPARDRAISENLRTFRGVPPSGAELYRGIR